MFSEPLFFVSRYVRGGGAQIFSEFIATFGLLSIVRGCARLRSADAPGFIVAQLAGAAGGQVPLWLAGPVASKGRAESRHRAHPSPEYACPTKSEF
jgi:hypothetical protein